MIVYQDYLSIVYCDDALAVMQREGNFDFCLLDAPWDKPLEAWIGPYLDEARSKCTTVLVNGGHHTDAVGKKFPPDCRIFLRHAPSNDTTVYLVYGETPAKTYTAYEDDGTRVSWHGGSQPMSRSRAVLDLFPDVQSVIEPFAGSATIARVARERGLRSVCSDIEIAYCHKVASMMREVDLTVIIPTLIHTDMLQECLMTLKHHAAYPCRVMVVDSRTDPQKQKEVDDVSQGFDVLHLGVHKGEQYAINKAVEHITTTYFAVIHDDVAFIPNSGHFWPRLVEVISHDDVGACGPALSNCTGLQHFMRWNNPLRHEVDYLYGACMVFRTDFYREVGGFDEKISPCDDVDLALRIRQAGKKIVIDRGCFLYHHRHQTFKITRPAKTDVTNLEVMFNKLIRKHGVRGFMGHLFEVHDWHWILQTCPTWDDIQRRLSTPVKEWKPGNGRIQRRSGSTGSLGKAASVWEENKPHMDNGSTALRDVAVAV